MRREALPHRSVDIASGIDFSLTTQRLLAMLRISRFDT
jgi:hypothetical protein